MNSKKKFSHYQYDPEHLPVTRFLVSSFFSSAEQLLQPIISEVGSVLEVGCGEGDSTKFLRRMFRPAVSFFASDIDTAAVSLAREKNPGVEFLSSESVYKLQRKAKSVDLILMIEVLEHLENPDQALSELARISRKYVLLSVPNEPLWSILNILRGKYWRGFGNTPEHVNRWNSNSLKNLLGRYFEVVKIAKPIPWMIALCQARANSSCTSN